MKRLVSMALLVAALLSATVSASAKGRKGDFRRGKRGDFRQEIRFQGNCPKMCDMRRCDFERMRMQEFRRPCPGGPRGDFRFEQGRREDFRFNDPRFNDRHHRRHHGKPSHRR